MAALRLITLTSLSNSCRLNYFNSKEATGIFAKLRNSRLLLRKDSQVSYRLITSAVGQNASIPGCNGAENFEHVENMQQLPSNDKRNISVEQYLSDIGTSLGKVKKQLDITRLSLERVKEKVDILKALGIEVGEVGRLISRRPTILVIREEVIQSRVKALREVGIEPGALIHVVKQSPGVLTAKIEVTLIQKVKFLQGLAVKPKMTKGEVLHMLTKCPDIIATCSMASLEDKINFLEKVLKFNQHQLRNILLKQPSTLTFSKDSMKAKYQYCYEQLNASRTSIARCPRLFQCSLKRIQERHQFLQHVGRLKKGMVVDDYGLGVIASPTDKYFADKVALSCLEDFDEFRQALSFNKL